MYEMHEIIFKTSLLFALFYFAWVDYKTKLIPSRPLLFMGMVGMCYRMLMAYLLAEIDNTGAHWIFEMLHQLAVGILPGGVLLLVALLTKESIGIGDAWLFMVTGVTLGGIQNFALVLGSFFLVEIFAIASLLIKKKGKDNRVAMGPLVLTAYVLFVL